MKKISVIVPCYNEEDVISQFYSETTGHLKSISDAEYEIIFVDDGSQDHTLRELKLLCFQDPHCHYLSLSRNFGKEAAMYAGLQHAEGDYCVIMDADLQHPPELLPEMYRVVSQEAYDCCGGKRIDREGEGRLRNALSRCFYKVMGKMTKVDVSDGAGDFRMMNRNMVDAVLMMKEYNRYMKGIYSFVGFRTKWIEFHNRERYAGKSKWSLKSLFSYGIEGILAFSVAPLTYAGIFGLLLTCLSLLLLSVCGIQGILGEKISAWILITTIFSLLSGIQMIFLYILGRYFSKDYLENKKRPIYIVKERK